ncbi:serine/threonine-protein kinase [Spirillospora sp. NPDC050679]
MTSVNAGPADRSGGHVGPYRLVRVLGVGGMGTVHLADAPGGGRVAVKVLRPEVTGSAESRERFRREVAAARQVQPFCTAPVLDADLDGDPPYVVTEYVPGPTLEDVIMARGPLRGGDLQGLAAGVATALTAIHSAGVVHRDLKPANILLSAFGPRVIDFGIARTLGVDSPLTRDNLTMGTPSFMAPEGLVGEPITVAADVFAWGCVVAYAGTGRLPFGGRNNREILYNTVHGQPQLEGLDPALSGLVTRALSKEPADRPSAVELLTELTGLRDPGQVAQRLQHEPPAPAPVPAPARPTTPTPGPHGPPRDGRTRLARKLPGRRRRVWLWSGAGAALLAVAAPATVALWPSSSAATLTKGPLLLSQDYAAPGGGWPSGLGVGFERVHADGVYRLRTFYPQALNSTPAPLSGPQRALVLSVKARVTTGDPADEAGLYCKDGDQAQYEILLSRTGSVRIRKGTATASTEKARSKAPVAEPGAAVELQAVCDVTGDGVRIQAWAKNKLVAEATDAPRPAGGWTAGLVQGRENRRVGDPDTWAEFDDFAAYQH